jgi:hypothetical protein
VHYPLAVKSGLDPKILSDIAAGKRPRAWTTSVPPLPVLPK